MSRPKIPFFFDAIILASGSIAIYFGIILFLSIDFVELELSEKLNFPEANPFLIYFLDLSEKYFLILREILPLFISICILVAVSSLLIFRRIDYYNVKDTVEKNVVILKIYLPSHNKEVYELMENIFESLHNVGANSLFKEIIGKKSKIYSFEMEATAGKLTFYIRCTRKTVNIVKNIVQGQYKGSKLEEVEDYVKPCGINSKKYIIEGYEYKLDKSSIFPLNTYRDLKLEDKGVEIKESKDLLGPLNSFFETSSAFAKDEYFWLQIITRASGFPTRKSWSILSKKFWKSESLSINVTLEIEKIKIAALKRHNKESNNKGENIIKEYKKEYTTPSENELIERMSRKASKPIYEVGIRSLYIRKKSLLTPSLSPALGTIFKRLSNNHNYLSTNRGHDKVDFLQPFQNLKWTERAITNQIFNHYRNRVWFFYPIYFSGITFVTPLFWYAKPRTRIFLSTEELATMFYFPEVSNNSHNIQQTDSKLKEPPLNLPQ